MEEMNTIPYSELITERLILRKLKQSDILEIFSLRTNDTVNKYIDRKKPNSIEEANEFILETINGVKNNKWIYWAITLKDNPKLIGTICLWNFSNKNAEIGFELNPEFQGLGFMNEALVSVLEFGFKTTRLDAIEAFVNKDNMRSINILEKNKFILDTKRKDIENKNNLIFTLKNSII